MRSPEPIRPLRVFLSYSHDSPTHMDRALDLCNRMRLNGIDANLDQYEVAPPEGWPRWAVREIEAADFVLIVCTELYRQRWDGIAPRGRGLGVKWEGAVLNQMLYESDSETDKFIPVVFTAEEVKHIPTVLRHMTRYDLSSTEGYEQLYRHLTKQPATRKPDLGPLLPLTPKLRTSMFPIAAEVRGEAPSSPQPYVLRRYIGWVTAIVLLAVFTIPAHRSLESHRQTSQPNAALPAQLLQGQILDGETGIPLAGVLVTLPELYLQQKSDQQGRYRFEVAVPAGQQIRLRAFHDGYDPISVDPPAGTDFLNTHHMRRKR